MEDDCWQSGSHSGDTSFMEGVIDIYGNIFCKPELPPVINCKPCFLPHNVNLQHFKIDKILIKAFPDFWIDFCYFKTLDI